MAAEGTACEQWQPAKGAFQRCTASLAGQPSPAASAACTLEVGPEGEPSLLVTLSVRAAGSYAEVEGVLNTLVEDIGDGSFGLCLWGSGTTGFKWLGVSSFQVLEAQPAAS